VTNSYYIGKLNYSVFSYVFTGYKLNVVFVEAKRSNHDCLVTECVAQKLDQAWTFTRRMKLFYCIHTKFYYVGFRSILNLDFP
jgi:hypothetical protein